MMLLGDRCLAVDLAQCVGSVLSHGCISAHAAVAIANSLHLSQFGSLALPSRRLHYGAATAHVVPEESARVQELIGESVGK